MRHSVVKEAVDKAIAFCLKSAGSRIDANIWFLICRTILYCKLKLRNSVVYDKIIGIRIVDDSFQVHCQGGEDSLMEDTAKGGLTQF